MNRSFYNAVALSQVNKSTYMPDTTLAIGNDEPLGSIPLLVPTDYVPVKQRVKIPTGADIPREKMVLDGVGDVLSLKDFKTDTPFYGDWLNNGY